jgi:transglutaminase-like putative cysteine protease
MNRSRLAVPSTLVTVFAILLVGVAALAARSHRATAPSASPALDLRSFEFTYQAHFPATPGSQAPVHLWIPYPTNKDAYQTPASSVAITENIPHAIGHDSEYGDQFVVFNPTPAQVAAGFDAAIRFTVTRKEYVAFHDGAAVRQVSDAAPSAAVLQRYLQPDKLVPLDGVIAKLAKEHTAGAGTPLEKARRIYDYVVSTMHYDKSGEGWGRGDAIWACDSKRGNCTDFHSVFIGMMRASGIPARFEIGFPLPEGKTEGEIPGYHCWSEFYIQGIGWIPVDASEASKNPAKKDYFFGALDVNRVLFTYGRDIRLSADHKGDVLNYFIYPYAEANGQPVKDLNRSFSFRDISPSHAAAGQ